MKEYIDIALIEWKLVLSILFFGSIIVKLIQIIIKKNKKLKKYLPIDNIDKEVKLRISKTNDIISGKEKNIKQLEKEENDKKSIIHNLKYKIEAKQFDIKELTRTIDLYSNDLELIENGVYEPIFNYDTSEEFKLKITEVKEAQKRAVQDDKSCSKPKYFSVDHSEAKGRAHIKRVIKLALRSFNNECEALIYNVKWNNIETFANRMYKSADMINKLNKSVGVSIKNFYIDLKIKELKLTHEKELKIQKEKEEQKAIRDVMREEEKARKEYEKAIKQAEDEEKRYNKMLDDAMKKAKTSSGEELSKLQLKIDLLNSQLEEAHTKSERTKSRAQLTRAGHVYIVSNIGSFGEDIYKIGLTRRLEPMDRVKELGDASVPFAFDVHAMIYSDDAPKLEKELHAKFTDHQVNKVNSRKEFFNVSLNEIKDVVESKGLDVELTMLAEAKEYRETLNINKNA